MKKYLVEIENSLQSLPKRTSKHVPESYIGGGQSKLLFLGIRAPHLKVVLKKGFSFSNFDQDSQSLIWDYIWWNSDCFEVMSLALTWYYEENQKTILKKHWPILKKWSVKIDNWAHSDTLSGIYAQILELETDLVYPALVKWNLAKSPWLRRLSIVSLIYYSNHRERVLPLKKILALVEPQIEFEHYYVQKGVGWTLREAASRYPDATYLFIKKHIYRLSTHAFSTATEKMSIAKKKKLKEMRKK